MLRLAVEGVERLLAVNDVAAVVIVEIYTGNFGFVALLPRCDGVALQTIASGGQTDEALAQTTIAKCSF